MFGPDDWPVWRVLRQAALAESPHAFGSRLADWQGDGDREARWRDRLGVPGSHNVVATLDGRPVGMASGVPSEEDGVVWLISMWVAPAARGRSVGDTLVEEVVQWARSVGARELRLSVVETNTAAARLYERHSFACTGEVVEEDGRRELVMARTVPGAQPAYDAASRARP